MQSIATPRGMQAQRHAPRRLEREKRPLPSKARKGTHISPFASRTHLRSRLLTPQASTKDTRLPCHRGVWLPRRTLNATHQAWLPFATFAQFSRDSRASEGATCTSEARSALARGGSAKALFRRERRCGDCLQLRAQWCDAGRRNEWLAMRSEAQRRPLRGHGIYAAERAREGVHSRARTRGQNRRCDASIVLTGTRKCNAMRVWSRC